MEAKNIKAETWLVAHYPSRKEWVARHKGIFSRNYSGDMRSCKPEDGDVDLSRDGLYEILPSALFFTGQELMEKDYNDFAWIERVLKQRLDRIKTVMLPFDSAYFNKTLALESSVNTTLAAKPQMLLETLIGTDFSDEKDPHIAMMAPYTVQAAQLRGNFRTLCNLITHVLGYKTDFQLKKSRVRFVVNRYDLSKAEFLAYYDELKPFFAFVEEWFVPFELRCEYKIRDYGRGCSFTGTNKLMLDYNSTLGNKSRVTSHESRGQ